MRDPRINLALRMGDNTLILAQQNSKWCGHAPTLEEDIALSNISLDLMGHAQMWLGLAAEIEGQGRNADTLAFFRDTDEFRNSLLVERPNCDFAITLMRQYLFDVWHLDQLSLLSESSDSSVSEISQKAVIEVRYHRERSKNLVTKLGDGTAESHNRMQEALNALWSYFGNLFEDSDSDNLLSELTPHAQDWSDDYGKLAPMLRKQPDMAIGMRLFHAMHLTDNRNGARKGSVMDLIYDVSDWKSL